MSYETIIEPPDILGIYTSDIKFCQNLNQSQDIWLGIALAAEKSSENLFVGVSNNELEFKFIKLHNIIKSTVKSLDSNVLRIGGKTLIIEDLFLHLVNETINVKKRILFSEKSVLCDLLDQMQPSTHKDIYDLVVQLYLLPRETLRTYSSEIESNNEFPSARKISQSYSSLIFQKNIVSLKLRARLARELLVQSQLVYVKWIAYKYKIFGLDYLDVIQEGNIGLIIAAGKFDVYKNNSFKTYALWWIRQRIHRAIAVSSRTIRIPVYKYEEIRNLENEYIRYQNEYGVDPTIEYLADKCEISIKKAISSLELLKPILSLEELEVCEHNIRRSIDNVNLIINLPVCLNCEFFTSFSQYNNAFGVPQRKEMFLCLPKDYESDHTNNRIYLNSLSDRLKDEHLKDLDDSIFNDQLGLALRKILSQFSDRDKEIIFLRYGLHGDEPKTLEEVGKIYKVTRERIRQIEAKTFTSLRKPRSAKILQAYLPPFDY